MCVTKDIHSFINRMEGSTVEPL